jgi:uncharacterized Zn finger protein
MTSKTPKTESFKQLSWDDLHEWAGSRVLSRGQSYQRSHRVQGLAQTKTGGVIAWVQGERRYTTQVDFENGELVSSCTCPYGDTCKHAVAVVLEYLDHLQKNVEVPKLDGQDERLLLVKGVQDEEEWDNKEEDEEYEEDEEGGVTDLPSNKSGKSISSVLKGFLRGQTKEQLISLLEDLAGTYSTAREYLQDRHDLSKGSVKQMVAMIRKEILELSSKPAWKNEWNDEGYIPDYSRVKDRLKSLLAKGYADEVVSLGNEVFDAGIRQLEISQERGETGTEISSCLDIVFQALAQSSLSPVEQMLWVIDAELEDDHEICCGSEFFWEKKQKASAWGAAADRLIERLNKLHPENGEDSFSRSYQRDRLSDWIIRALENAGRHEEIIPLCEQEAVRTGSYVRLVNVLKEAKRLEEAEHWIRKGIKATQKQWPGITSQLRADLRDMREKEGNWLQVAAFQAEDFLSAPSLQAYNDMKKAAERAKVWPVVREGSLCYLETGKNPQGDPSWPLPETGVGKEAGYRHEKSPMIRTLIDIAIAEKRPEDVLRWYDHPKSKKGVFWGSDSYQEDEIAEALADQYPDRALSIWKNLAERQIALTKPNAYGVAAGHLRKVRDLLKKLRREDEWKKYLSELRQNNARKSSLLIILARLEGQRIVG